MLRIPLILAAMYFSLVASIAQSIGIKDTSAYQQRKLKIEEVNFTSSYYHQEGNNAAVTGGIGSEKLSDYANAIDLKLTRRDKYNRVHNFDAAIGVDYYTSASSDKIDPTTISSASSDDFRVYPSLSWEMIDEDKQQTIGGLVSFSGETDYFSTGWGMNYSKESKDRSREFTVKGQAYIDFVKLIYPIEMRDNTPTGFRSRNTYSATFQLSQVINRRLQVSAMVDVALQQGFLSLPFNRVYFSDNTHSVENLPDSRFKLPVSLRASYFLGDRVIIRSFYRYYHDSWGLSAHTINLETPIKITPFLSLSPFYRYYTQRAIDYFAAYGDHTSTDRYYSSDYDLSGLNSHFFGSGIRLVSPTGILGIGHFNSIEVRYGHYDRSTGLHSDIVTLNLGFK